MGKMSDANQNNFSGRLGNMIVYYSRGQRLCRQISEHYNDAGTDKQKVVRNNLILRNNWASKFLDPINIEIMERGKKTLTAHNYFHHVNKLALKTEDGGVKYELLQFSVGKLYLPTNMKFSISNKRSGKISLTWNNELNLNLTAQDDRLRIIAIKEDQLEIIQGLTFFRKDENASFVLPWKKWDIIYLYAFFYTESTKKSTPTYFQQIQKPVAATKIEKKKFS